MLHSLKLWCEYQLQPETKRKNTVLLNDELLKEVYAEIERLLPSLVYCLAPKKINPKTGSSSLRASGMESEAPVSTKSEAELDKHAQVVYDWLDKTKVSRIRMLMNWQACGGLSFVASVYHRSGQCFRYHGESLHEGKRDEVSLEDFQQCIKVRHQLGTSGIDEEQASQASGRIDDFAVKKLGA